ncbi:MAG: FtsX-like permease family protein [Ekhidna sp.]
MNKKKHNPPKLAEKLLRRLLRSSFKEEVLGDLKEDFFRVLDEKSHWAARRTYWYQTFNYLRPFALKKAMRLNQLTMLKHYIKISWRTIVRNKAFSAIEIGGFAVGIAACILISLYVSDQVGYDKHYTNKDRIYRLVNQWSDEGEVGRWSNVHGPLKEVLEDNIPEMELVARTVLWGWGDGGANNIRKSEAPYNHYEEGFFYADPELLEILEISLIYGRRETALSEPNSMVISKSKADVFYPNEDPVGRLMVLNDNPESTYVIGGVMEDFSSNSHLQGDFILTLEGRKTGPGTSGWCCTNYNMYTRLLPHVNKEEVESKTAALRNTYVLDQLREQGESGIEEMAKYQSYYLQSVEDIYLNPEEVYDDLSHGSQDLVWIFGCIAGIILLLGCINFVNLATAKSTKRAKEIGLRKVVGSFRSNLIYQYLAESCVYCLMAIVVGLGLAWIALPFFNQLAGISANLPWLSSWFIPLLLLMALMIGILSGIYPAFYLSKFKPVEVLKGQTVKGSRASFLRSAMVVFQFTATVILIVGALVTHQQFQLIMNKSLGYSKDQVINVMGLEAMSKSERASFKQELKQLSVVENATLSDYLPVQGGAIQNRGYWIASRRQLDNGLEAARWVVDEDYLQTMEMEITQGRGFRQGTIDAESIIINEQMAELLGLEEPLGTVMVDMFDETYTVVGVVKDFYFESILDVIEPLVMVKGEGVSTLSARINADDMSSAMEEIGAVWESFNEHQALRFSFMDQRFERMYDDMNRAKMIFIIFAVLSVLVACLGLFALSIYMIDQRGKEMSVRKVLGASMGRVFTLLTFDFVKLVIISIAIAVPISWYLMDIFLEDMVNRIELSWTTFAVSGAMAIVIALGTISLESVKAALANPIKKLRSE